jgi:exopolysaccharide biosynthesis polyprenyl glycosylphosphotransferase
MQTTRQTAEALPVVHRIEAPDFGTGEGFSIRHRRGPWRDALRRRLLALADALSVLLAGLALVVVFGGGTHAAVAWCLLVPLWFVIAKLHGLYERDHRVLRHLTADELPSLLTWVTTGTAVAVAVLSLTGAAALSAAAALRLWAVVAVSATLLRPAARWVWRRVTPPERAVLLGSGPLEEATRRKLELFTDIHVDLVGIVADSELDDVGEAGYNGHVPAMLLRATGGGGLDRLILATQTLDERLIAELVGFCRAHRVKLSVVPPARSMFGTAVRLGHVADLPMIEYSTWDVPRSTKLMKRAIDVGVSLTGIVVAAPLMTVIAAAIRVETRGPSIFRQRRAGFQGRAFSMFKFRTMIADAEERLGEVVSLQDLTDPMFKLREDPRVTRMGRWLRRTSLDELPQLFNVLKGDMSLVGPRPEQKDLVDRYRPEHRFRLDVKPGMTGPMQVYGRGELRFDERLAVERDYVDNISISRDLRIMLLTVAPVVRGRGAF